MNKIKILHKAMLLSLCVCVCACAHVCACIKYNHDKKINFLLLIKNYSNM